MPAPTPYNKSPKARFTTEKKGERQPFKPRAWNHQDELKGLKGKPFVIRTLAGATREGVLVDSDQFTIKFQHKLDQSILTYFKSALEGYGAL